LSQESEKIRSFVAIELPRQVKDHLAGTGEAFSRVLRGAKWVRPEGMHLTLKFIGDVEPGRIPEIAAALETVAKKHNSFDAETTQPGAFPSPEKARVLWVGLEDGGLCRALAKDIDNALASLGFERERKPFAAHLTLARLREPAFVPAEITGAQLETVPFNVSRFTLFRSRLMPSGAIYSPLEVFELAK